MLRRVMIRSLGCVAFVFLQMLPIGVMGQEVAAPAPTAGAAPTPEVPPDDLTARSQQSRVELDAISVVLEGLGDVADARENIEQLQVRVDELLASDIDFDEPDNELLAGDIQKQAKNLREELSATGEALSAQAENLEALFARIKRLIDGWQPGALDDRDLPPALTERISGIVNQANAHSEETNRKLNGVVELQNIGLEMTDRLNSAIRKLETYDRSRQMQMLVAGSQPLWALTWEDIRSSWTRSQQNLTVTVGRDFGVLLSEHAVRVVAHVLLLPLVVFTMLTLRRRTDAQPAPTSRPVAMSLLVWLLLGTFLYLEAPMAVRAIVGILLAVSAASVLLASLPGNLKPGLLGVVLLFIIDRLTFSVPFGEALPRLMYLMLGLSMATISALGLRAATLGQLSSLGLLKSLLRLITLLALFFSLAGCVMNVLGYAQLGRLFVSGVVRSMAILLVLFSSLTTLADLVATVFDLKSLDRIRSLARNRDQLQRFIRQTLAVVAIFVWIWGTLALFGVDNQVFGAVAGVLRAKLEIGGIGLSLTGVLAFVIAVWLAMWASRIVRTVLNDDVLPRMALPRGVPHTISVTANYVIMVFGVMIGIGFLGIDLSSLALVVGALGVGIGFGLQNLVNNFVSGLILIFERPIQVGDVVEVGNLLGRVTHIGIRTSRVRTFSGSEVIVPNGDLASNQVTNWTMSDSRRRLELEVGVAYGTNTDQVTQVLYDVVNGDAEVLDDPAPMVVFEEFGDNSLNFRIYAWIGDFDVGFSTRHRLTTNINRAFAASGIQIPFPQRDLHFKTPPPGLTTG